jgi:hypothetical protein
MTATQVAAMNSQQLASVVAAYEAF